MKVESWLLLFIGIFFGFIAIAYWFLSYEDGGSVMLLGSCFFGFLPGLYYFFWHRRFKGSKYYFFGRTNTKVERAEDRDDATIADGAGVIASFPGSSIWPFVLGMGAFVFLLSLVFGIWLTFVGVSLIVTALIGGTVESRRGGSH